MPYSLWTTDYHTYVDLSQNVATNLEAHSEVGCLYDATLKFLFNVTKRTETLHDAKYPGARSMKTWFDKVGVEGI